MDKLALLERENAEMRERIAYLESCLVGDDQVNYAVLDLTAHEERIFAALMQRQQLTKEQLLTIVYAQRVDADLPEVKIIDVFICKIRKKLRPYDFEIETVWGIGYRIDPATKIRVQALLAECGGVRRRRAV